MKRDTERIERIQSALKKIRADALICALPMNVLLVSGYSPVIGESIAVATKEGQVFLVVPEDEQELANRGWADEVITFPGGSLDDLAGTVLRLRDPLTKLATQLSLFTRGIIAYECKDEYQPSTYVAMHRLGPAMAELLSQAFHGARLARAGKMLAQLRCRLTPDEIERVRTTCRIAKNAFLEGAKQLRAGLKETDAANLFRAGMSSPKNEQVLRADGFAFCMSGPNAAKAFAAFQLSRSRELQSGDFVLMHGNSYADGFWSDITRTFCLGEPDKKKRAIFDAIFESRAAALTAVRPGATGADVDRAARDVMGKHGFGKEFKHPTGHGVGFMAINHNALPRLHPESPDVLESGMIFNIEPGWYEDGYGGARHCDMVLATETGAEILSPFQTSIEELIR